MTFDITHCKLCPRRCGADRTKTVGICHCGSEIYVARAALHPWEEPCISGTNGSGTIFFAGCALGCIFCQYREISRRAVGKALTVHQLAETFLRLQDEDAHNINLVTGSHITPWIVQALELAIQTARTKADVMAEASGCAITSVANIQENNYNQTGRYTDYTANAAMMKADTAETVVQPGELSISAQVTVEFSIE